MSESREPEAAEMPDDDVLQKPSTEKEPDEEPKDAEAEPDAVDHRAVGIGVADAPPAADDPSDG